MRLRHLLNNVFSDSVLLRVTPITLDMVAGEQAGITTTNPDPFTSNMWSVDSGTSSGILSFSINTLPFDGGASISDVEYSLDGGTSWSSSGTTGDFDVSATPAQTYTDIRIRAVNSEGPADPSDSKSATAAASRAEAVAALSLSVPLQDWWDRTGTLSINSDGTGGSPGVGDTVGRFTDEVGDGPAMVLASGASPATLTSDGFDYSAGVGYDLGSLSLSPITTFAVLANPSNARGVIFRTPRIFDDAAGAILIQFKPDSDRVMVRLYDANRYQQHVFFDFAHTDNAESLFLFEINRNSGAISVNQDGQFLSVNELSLDDYATPYTGNVELNLHYIVNASNTIYGTPDGDWYAYGRFGGSLSVTDREKLLVATGIVTSPPLDVSNEVIGRTYGHNVALKHFYDGSVSAYSDAAGNNSAETGDAVALVKDLVGSADLELVGIADGASYSGLDSAWKYDGATQMHRSVSALESTTHDVTLVMDFTNQGWLTNSESSGQFVIASENLYDSTDAATGAFTIFRTSSIHGPNQFFIRMFDGGSTNESGQTNRGVITWVFEVTGSLAQYAVHFDFYGGVARLWVNGKEVHGRISTLDGSDVWQNDRWVTSIAPKGRFTLGDVWQDGGWADATAEFGLRMLAWFEGRLPYEDLKFLATKYGRTVQETLPPLGTIYVSSEDGDDANGGTSEADAVASLERATELLDSGAGNVISSKWGSVYSDHFYAENKRAAPSRKYILDGGGWGNPADGPSKIDFSEYATGWSLNRTLANGNKVWRCTAPAGMSQHGSAGNFMLWIGQDAARDATPATPKPGDNRDYVDKTGFWSAPGNGTTTSITDTTNLVGLTDSGSIRLLVYGADNRFFYKSVNSYDPVEGTITFDSLDALSLSGNNQYTIFNVLEHFSEETEFYYDQGSGYLEIITPGNVDPSTLDIRITGRSTNTSSGITGRGIELQHCSDWEIKNWDVECCLWDAIRLGQINDNDRCFRIKVDHFKAKFGGGVRFETLSDVDLDNFELYEITDKNSFQCKGSDSNRNSHVRVMRGSSSRSPTGLTFYQAGCCGFYDVVANPTLDTHGNVMTAYNYAHGLILYLCDIVQTSAPRAGFTLRDSGGVWLIQNTFKGGIYNFAQWNQPRDSGSNYRMIGNAFLGSMELKEETWRNSEFGLNTISKAEGPGQNGYALSGNIASDDGSNFNERGDTILVDFDTLYGTNNSSWPVPDLTGGASVIVQSSQSSQTLDMNNAPLSVDLQRRLGVTIDKIGPRVWDGSQWVKPTFTPQPANW